MIAAQGKVITQESKMVETVPILACLVTIPTPKSEPTETWVVETGKPKNEAVITKNPVARFAEKA